MAKILCVDDDANYLRLVKQELEEENYRVETAQNGADAIEKVRADIDLDLVIMDIRMPGIGGLEAMSQIFKITKNRMPVILNSAYSSYKDNFEAWSADAYVVKSGDFTELKKEVKRALERKAA